MTFRFFLIIACVSVATTSNAQEKQQPNVAKKYTAPGGFLESLPTGPDNQVEVAEDKESRDAGFGWYNNNRVNGNTRLLGSDGTTQISVYARDVKWRFAFGGRAVTSPSGNGGTAGGGWRFPNAHKFGIVIYQGNNYWNVTSTSPSSPTVISGISNTQPVLVTVNDTNGNYSDNGGAIDIYLRKDN